MNRGGDEAKARLADTLLDVIWQIDQEVDSGALEFRQAGGVFDTKKLADLGQAGRKRLAQFLKSLVVSPQSVSPPLERIGLTTLSELRMLEMYRKKRLSKDWI